MSRPLSDNWRTLMHRDGHSEPRPSAAYEKGNSEALREQDLAERRRLDEELAARRDELASMARHALEELRRLPQENRAKRQHIDRALREMKGV